MHTTTTTTGNKAQQTKVQAIVDTAVDVGLTWARFGLSVGRQALETNSKTLHLAAESLAKLVATLEAKKAHVDGEPAATTSTDATPHDEPKPST